MFREINFYFYYNGQYILYNFDFNFHKIDSVKKNLARMVVKKMVEEVILTVNCHTILSCGQPLA